MTRDRNPVLIGFVICFVGCVLCAAVALIESFSIGITLLALWGLFSIFGLPLVIYRVYSRDYLLVEPGLWRGPQQ